MQRTHVNNLVTALILIPVGALFAGLGYFLVLKPELRVKHEFVETTCTIVDKRLVRGESGTGTKRKTNYRPEFHIRYSVAGQEYEAATYDISQLTSSSSSTTQLVLDQFETGQEYSCWYDPLQPKTAVLTRETSWLGWIFTGLGAALASIGLLILLGYLALIGFVLATGRR